MRRFSSLVVVLMIAGCAEKPTPLHPGAPSAEAYPQVEDQCAAQPWLAWCVADAEKRRT